MSPRIGNESNHIDVRPADKDHTRIRIRLTASTAIVVILLLAIIASCIIAVLTGGTNAYPSLG